MPDFNPLPEFDRGHRALTSLPNLLMRGFGRLKDHLTERAQTAGQVLSNPRLAATDAMEAVVNAYKNLPNVQSLPAPGQQPDQAQIDKALDIATSFAPAGILAGLASKTLPAMDLMEASSMARKGADPHEIWWKTGFGKAPDGQWRYEIPDDHAFLKLNPARKNPDVQVSDAVGPASSSIYFPEIFKAYPTVDTVSAQLRLAPDVPAGRGHGFYSSGPAEAGFKGGQLFATASDERELSNITLHELQHMVQKLQGWQQGGNPDMFMPKGTAPGMYDGQAYQLYRKLQGEAEARLVQQRQHLTPQARREQFPFSRDYFAGATGFTPDQVIQKPELARILTQLGQRP